MRLNSEIERFWKFVDKTGTCWLWTGAKTKGYGRFGRQGAHRFSWILANGPIPKGKCLDHLCRVPSCVRPDHLEPVTNRENILRGIGPSAINAQKTHCTSGDPYSQENTYVMRQGGRMCRLCIGERNWNRFTKHWRNRTDPNCCPKGHPYSVKVRRGLRHRFCNTCKTIAQRIRLGQEPHAIK